MGAVENLADEIVSAIAHSPALRARLRTMLDEDRAPVHAANDDALRTASIDDYAAAVQIGRRTVEGWIKRGLPTLGSGRGRRIDLGRADAWVRANGIDASEAEARELAKVHGRRAAR